MVKVMCDAHEDEFFELNKTIPRNIFQLRTFSKKAPLLEIARYPNVQGCQDCLTYAGNNVVDNPPAPIQ